MSSMEAQNVELRMMLAALGRFLEDRMLHLSLFEPTERVRGAWTAVERTTLRPRISCGQVFCASGLALMRATLAP